MRLTLLTVDEEIGNVEFTRPKSPTIERMRSSVRKVKQNVQDFVDSQEQQERRGVISFCVKIVCLSLFLG